MDLFVIKQKPQESTGMTPFYLVSGGETIVPVEVRVESDCRSLYDHDNGDK